MKIEVWSDFACPFCYVGKRRLEEALTSFTHGVEVEYKSFELDPNAATDVDSNVYELLSKKYGASIEQAKNMARGMKDHGAQVGIEFNFDDNIPTNTFNAHRLSKLASDLGQGKEMTESLFKAHLTDGKHIGDKETLLSISEKAGLDREEAARVLEGSHFSEEVRFDEEEARQFGIQGVPFFVINRKYAISGAQPVEVFADTLKKVWEEENGSTPFQTVTGRDNLQCDENGCDIPKYDQ
ncbi:DsbA family oxidoreductase [Rossellomorea aquimaris]|uniref:DsbA family oxidoreductase n=1 Tax=Rossellomorea aquimaris TaxID=189382 RepID=UPI001CD66EC3|nr:DsbA family oxidoreductase [Rossellomorea aquimaris]MCA1053890.1 DsbA family oxidoreductase [Rossellomorea aquimaris]